MNKFTTKSATPPPNFELSTINPALSRIGSFITLAGQNSLSASFLFSTDTEVVL